MTQLYVILSSTQGENKEEIKKKKKTQEEIKKLKKKLKRTQKEINVKSVETQSDFKGKLMDIEDLIERRGGLSILLTSSYTGVL